MSAHLKPTGQTSDFNATVQQLKALALQSTDALLTEGEVNPDWQLLDLCAEAIMWRRRHDEAMALHRKNDEQRFADCHKQRRNYTDAERKDSREEYRISEGHDSAMKLILIKAKKLKATTAAGIYAKALIVRSSKTGATLLAMSLADDLIGCPGLRESLWPKQET